MSRVLVAYGSKHGSTAEIAEAIAATLREAGLQADCVKAGDVRSLEGYDAVVLGSAVYMRRWRRAASQSVPSLWFPLDRPADERLSSTPPARTGARSHDGPAQRARRRLHAD